MGSNEELDLDASGDVESTAHVVAQDDNDDGDKNHSGCDDCHIDFGDKHPDDSERNEDKKSIQIVELDKDTSDILSKMVMRLCSICRNFFKGRFTIQTKLRDSNTLKGRGAKVYHPSLLSLEGSINDGCPLCQELSQGLEKLFKRNPELQKLAEESSSIWCHPEKFSWASEDERAVMLTFHLCEENGHNLGDDFCPDIYGRVESLLFFPAGILGIGPELRGTEPLSYLAMVT